MRAIPKIKVERKGNEVIIHCPDMISAEQCKEGIKKTLKSKMTRALLMRQIKRE